MNTMTYKGYLGSVAFSEKDQVFFGKIEGINGLINFEGDSVKELTEAFHEAVTPDIYTSGSKHYLPTTRTSVKSP